MKFLQQSKAFWSLFGAAAILMMTFAFFQDTFILYLMQHFQLSTNASYSTNGIFASSVYLSAVLGGALTMRWLQPISAILLGLFFMGCGLIISCFGALALFLAGISIYIVGYGLLYTNIFVLVGKLYPMTDTRRESSFTLAYIGLNVGALVGFFIGGLAISYSTFVEFSLLMSLICLLGAVAFLIYLRHFFVMEVYINQSWIRVVAILVLVAALFYISLSIALQAEFIFSIVCSLLLLSLFGLTWHIWRRNLQAGKNMLVLSCLVLANVVYWTGYRLQSNIVLLFLQAHVSRFIADISIPAPTLYDINPITILLLGPLLSYFWLKRGNSQFNNPVYKISIGLSLLAISFICLGYGAFISIPTQLVWACLFLFILSLSELIVGPTMLSMIGQLSEEKYHSLLLGMTKLSTGAAGLLAGQVAILANNRIEMHTSTASSYSSLFSLIGIFILVSASLTLIVIRIKTHAIRS